MLTSNLFFAKKNLVKIAPKEIFIRRVISKSPCGWVKCQFIQISTHKQNIRYSFIMLILNPMFLVTMFGAAKKCGLDSGDILVSMKKDFS